MTGAEFRRIRLELGVTQRRLAGYFGLNVSTIKKYEKATRLKGVISYAMRGFSRFHRKPATGRVQRR